MGGAGATGEGIKVMSGIFVEGGYWRVEGWTKMASAEKMSWCTNFYEISISLKFNKINSNYNSIKWYQWNVFENQW